MNTENTENLEMDALSDEVLEMVVGGIKGTPGENSGNSAFD